MKTRLWATLTANGSYAQATPEQPPRAAAPASFGAHVAEARNFVVGRKTFEAYQAQPSRGGAQPFDGVDIVVVTRGTLAGVTCVASPTAALAYLRERGHALALLAGGEQLHDAFLAADLVDELALVVTPVLGPKALRIASPRYRELALAGTRDLGEGIVELRYGCAAPKIP